MELDVLYSTVKQQCWVKDEGNRDRDESLCFHPCIVPMIGGQLILFTTGGLSGWLVLAEKGYIPNRGDRLV